MDELLEKFIFHIGGDPCVILAHELEKLGDKEITDQELAEMLSQDLNSTRKNLYKLMDYDLVIYRRTRDKKNGWIIFFFKQNFDGFQNVLVERNNIQIRKWKELLDFEKDNIFYGCIAGCARESFDKAMEMDFRCPSCDEIMNMLDNSQRINDLTTKIEATEHENSEILATKKKPVVKKKTKARS